MNIAVALLAPVALLITSAAPSDGRTGGQAAESVQHGKGVAAQGVRDQSMSATRRMPDWVTFAPDFRLPPVRQVRIERRVILRVSPRLPSARQDFVPLAPQSRAVAFQERSIGKCMNASGILGAQPVSRNVLRLHLRGRRVVNLRLAGSCPAQSFYSGFYMEPHEDGQLCVRRDLLHSRSGTKCTVESMRELVPVITE